MNHCWHRSDQNSMSFPPTQSYVCCHCGWTQTLFMRVKPGCGSHAPKDDWEKLMDAPCPKRTIHETLVEQPK